jgi:hypothetical protein
MSTNRPESAVRLVAVALTQGTDAHARQRDLVRASLLVR